MEVSNPRVVSDVSRSFPVFPATYSRFSGSPSGPSIRSAILLSRLPGKRFTGMLTRPKLIVPDQNGRTLASLSRCLRSPAPLCLVLLLGNLLLRSALQRFSASAPQGFLPIAGQATRRFDDP